MKKWATFCKLRSPEKLYHFSRKTTEFLVIEKCRNGPLAANYDRKKNFTICQEKLYNFSWSWNEEKGHFLQTTIARKTRPFLKKNYTISRDGEMQKWATFSKLLSQEKLYHFSRKTIQFLVIMKWRKGALFANYDHKKNQTISQEKPYWFSWSRIAEMGHFLQITIARKARPFLKKNHTISPDRKLQNMATFCKLRSQGKPDHFSRQTLQFLVITKWRNGPLSPNYDRQKNFTISQEKLQNFLWSRNAEMGHFL